MTARVTPRRQVTKPKQAASKSVLDQWQRAVTRIIVRTDDFHCPTCRTVQAMAKHLLASMREAERR